MKTYFNSILTDTSMSPFQRCDVALELAGHADFAVGGNTRQCHSGEVDSSTEHERVAFCAHTQPYNNYCSLPLLRDLSRKQCRPITKQDSA